MTDIHALLKLMVDRQASDLFLTCGAPAHIKIDGVTHAVHADPLKPGEVEQMVYSIMTERQTAAFEETRPRQARCHHWQWKASVRTRSGIEGLRSA